MWKCVGKYKIYETFIGEDKSGLNSKYFFITRNKILHVSL